MTQFLPFVYDLNKLYTNQKCFILLGEHIEYLTIFFNSSLFKYCFIDYFPKLGDKGRELSKVFFEKIPIKKISTEVNETFIKLLIDIQKEYTKEKAVNLDKIIFDMYNITDTEREIIGFIE